MSMFILPILYGSWKMTLYHILIGPLPARLKTENLNEFAAIWCLLSIGFLLIVVKMPVRRILYVRHWPLWPDGFITHRIEAAESIIHLAFRAGRGGVVVVDDAPACACAGRILWCDSPIRPFVVVADHRIARRRSMPAGRAASARIIPSDASAIAYIRAAVGHPAPVAPFLPGCRA